MIRGLGCDLCAIGRMEEIIHDGRFLRRYFTENEQKYILDHVRAAQTAAGMFAAKEALLKALGTGLSGLDMRHIEITHSVLGAPEYTVNEHFSAALQKIGSPRAFLSISHDGDYAMATAVLEGD